MTSRVRFEGSSGEVTLPPPGAVLEQMKASVLPECERTEFLHTGSLMLNLAASGRGVNGGWGRGRIHNVVGDGSSGKTLTQLELLAYAHHRLLQVRTEIFPKPKRLRLLYYNGENVMDFPVEQMYGQQFYDSVEWITKPFVEDIGEHFFGEVVANHREGDVVIAVVDSWDSIRSKLDAKTYEKNLKKAAKAAAEGESDESKGSYNLGKQKYGSQYFFPRCCADMQGKDITLGIVSQVRQKIGVTFGEKRYRAGGDALNFYTHQVCWLAERQKLTHTINGHTLAYGIKVRGRFKRNKCALPFREAEFDIILNYGIDDVGGMLDWRYGPKATEIKWRGKTWKRTELAKMLKVPDMYQLMAAEITEQWQELEAKSNPRHGQSKYGE